MKMLKWMCGVTKERIKNVRGSIARGVDSGSNERILRWFGHVMKRERENDSCKNGYMEMYVKGRRTLKRGSLNAIESVSDTMSAGVWVDDNMKDRINCRFMKHGGPNHGRALNFWTGAT